MRQVMVKAFGDENQLELMEHPDPRPQAGQALVRIKACGLNYSDLMMRAGLYPGGPRPPFPAGSEAAGEVLEVNQAGSLQTGSRVALVGSGLLADRAVAGIQQLISLPETLSFEEGAAFPIQYLTAYHALTTVADAQPGQTVLIHAAAGGVGTAAVQMGRLLGLQVAGTASTAEKRSRVSQLGAHAVFSYDEFPAGILDMTAGRGPEVILESVGGEVFRNSLGILAPLGRMVVYGLASRETQPLDTVKLLFKSKGVLGFHLQSILTNPPLLEASLRQLFKWLQDGQLAIQVGHRLPLSQVRQAHRLMASRQSYGKIVLIPD